MIARSRLRVAWLVHYPVFGGPHNRILRLSPLLEQRGIDVTAILPTEPGNATIRLIDGGVHVIELPIGRARAVADARVQARYLTGFRSDVRRLRGLLRTGSFDVLISAGLINAQGPIAASLEGIPVVWQILDSRTPRLLAALLIAMVDRLASVATFAGSTLIEQHPGAERLRIPTLVSTPGVDPDRFAPSARRRAITRGQLGIPPDALVFGTVANVNPQKGIEVFVAAAARISETFPNAYFVVVGSYGQSHPDYQARIQADLKNSGLEGPRFIFAGDQSSVEEWYPAFDVMLMTSVPHSEGTPTVILEAWACGVPVIATNVGAVDALVEDGVAGHLVPPLDDEAIAARAVELAENDERRRAAGAAGRMLVERQYTTEHVADIHAAAIELAISASA